MPDSIVKCYLHHLSCLPHLNLDAQPRPTLFGELTDDVSRHEFLALRVRAGGHARTRNSYFVNINTDEPVPGDLWQHRLFFTRDEGGWEDIFVRAQTSSTDPDIHHHAS